MKKVLFIALLLCGIGWGAKAQTVAVKSNILYDATATVNLVPKLLSTDTGRWISPAIIMAGMLRATSRGSIGWCNPRHVTGCMKSLTAIISEFMAFIWTTICLM